jgi:hypothetical protein
LEKNVTKNASLKLIGCICAFVLITGCVAVAGSKKAESPEDFFKLYPGVYTEREKSLVEKYIADNKALEERGEIDVQALINGTLPKETPGIGPVIKVTEDMVRYNNQKYDPENPVLHDAAYAKKLGYKDILAYPTFGGHDDTFMVPYPPPARDKLLVSDLNHNFTNYRPVYPGDTLYLVMNSRQVTDLTPTEGSIYRGITIQSKGSIYNQKGEKVTDVIFRVTESIRVYKEGKGPKNPGFFDMWDAPDWMSRSAHYYTDKDWDLIRKIWSEEKRQGAAPLYWEDVKVGDEPAWTLDGPIEASVAPVPPWGMGLGGSRTMKKEIMDPDMFKTMVRGKEDGIYRLPNKEDYIPPAPVANPMGKGPGGPPPMDKGPEGDAAIDTTDIHKKRDDRAPLINYMGRDFAIRHINNWMGDHGWLHNIRWSIMDPRCHALYGKDVPVNPQAERFLSKVPKMKDKYVNAHGLTNDVAIVKSYVYDKYVRDGNFMVELAWWIESIDGDIWEEGGATIKLPSKRLAK